MRRAIAKDLHEALGHVGAAKLSEALLTAWWWERLREDASSVVRECTVCARDRAPLSMQDTPPDVSWRPDGPFLGWSIDLAGPFPPDEDGNKWLAVAVDVCSKWVEAQPLRTKHAFTTASWFYQEIIARWGKPQFIRCDHGTEWEAEFRAQCRALAITMRQGAVGNSRANGQAERAIQTLKSVIRRLLDEEPTSYWTDSIPYCLMAMRMAPAAAHGFPPFTVITGSTPILPTQMAEDPIEQLDELSED
jgi:Integrase zinc binding domain/Integrase core domain